MVAFPFLLLALAAGIYLLMKATREYLGGLFKGLAWLVILLSLLGIIVHIAHGIHHRHMRHRDGMAREEQIMIRRFDDGGKGECCMMMQGCKMQGDSVVLDKAVCEKLMGKDSCDKICAQRGQCILSKDECLKLCGGESKCTMMGAGSQNSCCAKGPNGAAKECCKKK